MKNLFLAIILGAHITAAGQPLMTDTDVPTEGAEEDGKLYHEGQAPIWVHGKNDEPVYYVLNEDCSYYEVDEKTYVQFCKLYCEDHNQVYFDGYPADRPGLTIEAAAAYAANLKAYNNYEAAQMAAREVLSASDIPKSAIFLAPGEHPGALATNDPMYYYKLPDGSYYKVSPETYIEYVKDHGGFPADGDDFSSGTGNLVITANVFEDLQEIPITLIAYERTSENRNVIKLNAPDYTAEMSFPSGSYTITLCKAESADHSVYCEADCSMYGFFIADGATTNFNIDIVPKGTFEKETEEVETFDPAEPTPAEEIQEDPKEEAAPSEANEVTDSAASVGSNDDIEKDQKNGNATKGILIGGVVVVVAAGVAVFVKRKKGASKD